MTVEKNSSEYTDTLYALDVDTIEEWSDIKRHWSFKGLQAGNPFLCFHFTLLIE